MRKLVASSESTRRVGWWIIAAGLVATLLGAERAHAEFLVYGTGVDDLGVLLGAGTADSHYLITQAPANPSQYPDTRPFAPKPFYNSNWVENTASSQWINPTGISGESLGAGSYWYATTFDLTGYDPSTAIITGKFASDNGSTIWLNGVSTGISHSWEEYPDYTFRTLDTFTINGSTSGGLIAGLNTLEFRVENEGAGDTGIQVQIVSATATPEPSTFVLLGVGAISVFGYTWRRRKRTA